MPQLATFLAVISSFIIVRLIFRVMAFFGIAFIVFEGWDTVDTYLSNEFSNRFSAIPPEIIELVGYLQVDVAVSMILSAYLFRIALAGYKVILGRSA